MFFQHVYDKSLVQASYLTADVDLKRLTSFGIYRTSTYK